MIKKIFLSAFLLGIVLLLIDVYGLFIPIGNNKIYTETKVLHKDDIDRKAQAFLKEVLTEKNITNREEYLKKVVLAVNKNIAHYWWGEGRTKYNLTIPIYNNFLLWFKQFTDSRHYRFYEFCDYHRALERKVGLCSQHAITICGILKEKKIPCEIVGLSGHVVSMAKIYADKYWILDGDYGVVVPYSIKEIEKNPSIIIPYYKGKIAYSSYALAQAENNKGKNTGINVISLKKLVNIYGKEGNIVFGGVKGYCNKMLTFEKLSYFLIWLIPILLIFPFLVIKIKAKK